MTPRPDPVQPEPGQCPVFLFVYGLLRRGEPLHFLLQGSPFLGEGFARDHAVQTAGDLVSLYPSIGALTPGEVYRVDPRTIALVDSVELPAGYRRRAIPVLWQNTTLIAQSYLVNGSDHWREAVALHDPHADRVASPDGSRC